MEDHEEAVPSGDAPSGNPMGKRSYSDMMGAGTLDPPSFEEFDRRPFEERRELYTSIVGCLRALRADLCRRLQEVTTAGGVHGSCVPGEASEESRTTATPFAAPVSAGGTAGTVDPATTLIGKLLRVVESVPQERWLAAAFEFERPPLQARAVSIAFIRKMVESLKAVKPMEFTRLNSYMIVGSKNFDCACHPDKLDDCMHFQDGKDGRTSWAKEPWDIREPWVIRAITWRTGGLSLIETFMLAADITGAPIRGLGPIVRNTPS
jgi:hypothetical protein